jgi:hypothetical protein
MISDFLYATKHSFTNTSNIICITHRLAHPHIGVDVPAVNQLAIATWLFGTDLTVVAAMALGITVVCTVLPAGGLTVHVHLILNLAL